MPQQPAYLGIRSIIETPLLDERKWGKIPGIPADAIFIDLEDSLPPARKEEGRARAVQVLGDPGYFGGRVTISRPNALDTPWGRDDIQALAEAGVTCVALPKLRSADELLEAQELFRAAGADPDIFAIVETAQAVLEVRSIAAAEKVVAIMFGAGDLSVDSSIPLLGPDTELNPAMITAKVQAVLAGSAFGANDRHRLPPGHPRPHRDAPPLWPVPADRVHGRRHFLSSARRDHQRDFRAIQGRCRRRRARHQRIRGRAGGWQSRRATRRRPGPASPRLRQGAQGA